VELEHVQAMINLDMVGRLRENRVSVLGAATADEWPALVSELCDQSRVSCQLSGDGYGPSDQTSFYAIGLPVLHFFTGAHEDYHKPSDTIFGINAAGAAQIATIVGGLTRRLGHTGMLTFQKGVAPEPRGDMRSFNASLGTIPDYAGPKDGVGVLLQGVRDGGAAARAGMKRGDVLIKLGSFAIESVHDLVYALNSSKPGQVVVAVVLRDGKSVELTVTLEARGGPGGRPHGGAKHGDPPPAGHGKPEGPSPDSAHGHSPGSAHGHGPDAPKTHAADSAQGPQKPASEAGTHKSPHR
jgi:hypothetical protein